MKNILRLFFALVVVFSLALTCFATDETLSVTDAAAKPGDVVYLTLMLNEKTVGNSVGVSSDYDSSLLVPVPASSSWAGSGSLQNFNKKGDGVWAVKTAKDLQGTVCVLAFQVKEDVTFTTTTVQCALIVKNVDKDVGTYTAEAVITNLCDHSYGEWESAGMLGHSRTCSQCKGTETESHSWDDGKVSAKPGDSKTNLMTYTCSVCGETKVIEFAANSGESVPTVPTVPVVTTPAETLPTAPTEAPTPATRPTEESTRPTEEDHEHIEITYPNTGSNPGTSNNQNNTQNNNGSHDGHDHTQEPSTLPYTDYNQPTEDADDHSGHSHENPNEPPMVVPIVTGDSEEEAEEEHVHTEDEVIHQHDSISVGSVCAVLGVLVIIIIAAVFIIKKKR